MSEIRVLVVEDEPLIAEDIRDLLDSMDYEISAHAMSGEEALEELADNTPDIVLLDINLEGEMDGIQVGEILHKEYQLPFVYLTSYANKSTVERAKHTHPMGYIVKPFDEKDLFTSLEIALYNYGQMRKPAKIDLSKLNHRLLSHLTKKEYEILLDIYEGKTNRLMAEKHFVSINTIKTHVKNIYDKLNVNTRSQAIVRVRELLA